MESDDGQIRRLPRIAAKIGKDSRFSSIQVGVSQESFGESIQRNMSWAGYDRPLSRLPDELGQA